MGVKVRGKKKSHYRTESGYCYNKANTRMAKYWLFSINKPFNLKSIKEAGEALIRGELDATLLSFGTPDNKKPTYLLGGDVDGIRIHQGN